MTLVHKAEANSAESAPKLSPVKAMGNRGAYFPGTDVVTTVDNEV